MKFEIKDINKMEEFGNILSKYIKKGDVFSLVGDLGAGKTTLVQFICKAMNIDEYVTSPTFSIVNIYNADMDIYHLDLYRLNSPRELDAMDYENYFYPDGITFIEWAENGGNYIPEDIIKIKIDYAPNGRIIEILEDTQRAKFLGEKLNENFSG